jgi:hypothetical protein
MELIDMPDTTDTPEQNAKHLAARAVMAYRAGFPVEIISISGESGSQSGIVSDWKKLRDSYGGDEKLLRRGFAFIYIGTIIDQNATEPISNSLRKELVSDMSSALYARETAVQWGLAHSMTETNPFAHTGYKLASRPLRADQTFIDALAAELCVTPTLRGEQLKTWCDSHANPLVLEELERTTTF